MFQILTKTPSVFRVRLIERWSRWVSRPMSIRANHRLYAMAILLANSLLALKKESATLFDKFRKKTATAKLIEEQLYEQVVHELQQGRKRDGLWAKALVNSEGSEQKAKSLYIEYRVQSIKDEIQISVVLAEEAKNTAVVEYQKRLNRCMCALESKGYQFISTKTGHGWIIREQSGSCELIETIEELEGWVTE